MIDEVHDQKALVNYGQDYWNGPNSDIIKTIYFLLTPKILLVLSGLVSHATHYIKNLLSLSAMKCP